MARAATIPARTWSVETASASWRVLEALISEAEGLTAEDAGRRSLLFRTACNGTGGEPAGLMEQIPAGALQAKRQEILTFWLSKRRPEAGLSKTRPLDPLQHADTSSLPVGTGRDRLIGNRFKGSNGLAFRTGRAWLRSFAWKGIGARVV